MELTENTCYEQLNETRKATQERKTKAVAWVVVRAGFMCTTLALLAYLLYVVITSPQNDGGTGRPGVTSLYPARASPCPVIVSAGFGGANVTCPTEAAVAAVNCSSGFVRYPACWQSCYRLIWTRSLWMDAQRDCERYGSHLVEIDSEEEQDLLIQLLGFMPLDLWTGGKRMAKGEPHFIWTNSSTNITADVYSNWREGEPNNLNMEEDYLVIFGGSGAHRWGWNDHVNVHKYYLCEKPFSG